LIAEFEFTEKIIAVEWQGLGRVPLSLLCMGGCGEERIFEFSSKNAYGFILCIFMRKLLVARNPDRERAKSTHWG